MVEAEALRPDADHAPGVEDDDGEGDGVEHGLGRQAEVLLDAPERVDPDCLGGDADEQEVRQRERVVGHDGVLQRRDDRHGRVEGVAEEEIPDEVEEGLLEMPDLAKRARELPESDGDDVHSGRDLQWSASVGFNAGLRLFIPFDQTAASL